MRSVLVFCYCCHKLAQTQWLKTTQTYYLTFLEVRTELKARNQQSCLLFWKPWEISVFWPFPGSRGCPHGLACAPFHPQSQQRPTESSSQGPTLTLTLLLPASTSKDLCVFVGSTHTIQGNLPVLWSSD